MIGIDNADWESSKIIIEPLGYWNDIVKKWEIYWYDIIRNCWS